ncbi:hypothetical protein [Riemerella anatipestifer]|nr:hypothetical protein [Riemerella anatipestifer]
MVQSRDFAFYLFYYRKPLTSLVQTKSVPSYEGRLFSLPREEPSP